LVQLLWRGFTGCAVALWFVCRLMMAVAAVGWWGCWCPWLLQARTVHAYNIATSAKANGSYWAAVLLIVLLLIAGGPLGLLIAIGVSCWLVYRGATWRRQIREAEGIQGDFANDVLLH